MEMKSEKADSIGKSEDGRMTGRCGGLPSQLLSGDGSPQGDVYLQGVHAFFSGSDADSLLNGKYKDFSVSDLS